MTTEGERAGGQGPGRDPEAGTAGTRPIAYCLIPPELAPKLHDLLHRHFADDPSVEVIVERRHRERRRRADRRRRKGTPPATGERRRIKSAIGRRAAERRAALVPIDTAPELPRRARRYAEQISFVERLEPSGQQAEDADTARLVIRFQGGDESAFNELYTRYFARVYGYLRVAFKDSYEAEDATQQVFLQVFESLGAYERRRQPFRAWLFTVARHHAVRALRKLGRVTPVDINDAQLERELSTAEEPEPVVSPLDWISDRDLLVFVERLPLAQRQVLILGYMLDLSDAQIAAVLGRSPADIRTLRHRAVRFLEARLRAIGRAPEGGKPVPWVRRVRKAPVLRNRRHALLP